MLQKSGRFLCVVGAVGIVLLLPSCSTKEVRAGGYQDVELGQVRLRLPDQFQRIQNPAPGERPPTQSPFLGDVAGVALDQNFWAVTHAFAFREQKNALGEVSAPAFLVVSRVADAQSLSHAQLQYESAARFSPLPRWRTSHRLSWQQQRVSPALSFSTAELESGKPGSTVYAMSDRENLLEAILIGENTVLSPAVAREVLTDLRGNYRVVEPLESYFHQNTKEAQRLADVRRKNYLALLQTLQKEELDYSPTPRVVVFNASLAGQFWWPMFDRSGVPAQFAIAAKLGEVREHQTTVWQKLTEQFLGMQVVGVSGELGKPWQWANLSGKAVPGSRMESLLQDTGWLGSAIGGSQQAFATLEFPFSSPVPNVSLWLDAVEGLARRAESDGLVAPASSR
ncbi:hypothetical protein [Bryobacter aggregatus]|uniref:hypothetical protein n=1 Tax=Bryobacter aggregatus TaxID=360054 RepID=UPI0004E146D1|nr:hypothetical protein [Bryobacter aggregatus]